MNTNNLLISKTIRAYFFIGIASYLIIFLYWLNSVNYYNLLSILVFFTYTYLLWVCVDKDEEYFSNRRLGLTVFVYSLIFVTLYLQMSYYYTGNTFLFSERDARIYERLSFEMKDMAFTDALKYISDIWNYDDWGAPMSMAFILKIVPSKLFLNFCYVLMNVTSTLLLKDIGRMIGMSKKYSFMAALSYSLASYSIFFMGAFLKEEILNCLVITSFWMLYKYRNTSILLYIIGGGIVSLLIVFFRVPVALFIWLAFASWFLLGDNSAVKKGLFFFLIIAVSFLAIGLVEYSTNRYANGGDVGGSYYYEHTTKFEKLVSTLGALIGPFPSLFQITTNVDITGKALYGSGVLFKLLLLFPFWKGTIYIIRSRWFAIYPLIVFCLLEMIGLALAFQGLELRKAMPHIPLFILVAFWYLYQFDCDTTEEIRATPYYYWSYLEYRVCLVLVLLMTLVWNTLVRTEHLEHLWIQLTPLFTT